MWLRCLIWTAHVGVLLSVYLLELYNEVEDLLFHATTSTPFLCIALLSPISKTIQSVMKLCPKEQSMHLHAGEWEEQLWTQTTAWELQCRCLSTWKALDRQRFSFTVLDPQWSTGLFFIPPHDCVRFQHIQLHLSIVTVIQAVVI